MTQQHSVSANSVPALARTDVRPGEPAVPERRRRSAGRAVWIALAVLATVALLVVGLVVALRYELADPTRLGADILSAWRR